MMANNTVRPQLVEGHSFKPANREQIVTTARSWLGTPYQHQARCKGVGVDCAGLIVGVAKDLQLSDFDCTTYGRRPAVDLLTQIMRTHTRELPASAPWLPAQICLMRFDSEPQHLGLLGGVAQQLTLIHAYGSAAAVVEHRLAQVWQARVLARFDYFGVV